MKTLAVILSAVCLLGCSQEQAVMRNATIDDMAKAVCSISTNGMPVATGFFVSHSEDYFLVTASHVPGLLGDETPSMVVAKTNGIGSVEEMCFGKWFRPDNRADVCVLKVTDRIRTMIERGADFACIDLDVDAASHLMPTNSPYGLPGVGMLCLDQFKAAGVGRGREAFMLASSTEVWEGYENRKEVPITYRGGRIANVATTKCNLGRGREGLEYGPWANLITTDISVIGGASGAPVFVRGDARGAFLVGVMVSIVPPHQEIKLSRSEGVEIKQLGDGRFLIKGKEYIYKANTFLSYVVPMEPVMDCLASAQLQSFAPINFFGE